MTAKVFHYVQHLQGVGHVIRSQRIARALAEDGFSVTMVLGGLPVPSIDPAGVDCLQLPPLKAGPNSFRELLTSDGTTADASFKARRRGLLLDALKQTQPDIVLIEAFPFDRPQMHFELVPLLDAVMTRPNRPTVISSIRDILQKKTKPERDITARDLLVKYFDQVLVHGDARLAQLEETFPYANEIAAMVTYTGIVGPPQVATAPDERFDVIISTGGGATDGHRILAAAIAAKPLTSLTNARWLALAGPYLDTSQNDGLVASAASNDVTLRPFVNDLAQLLAHARVSISQAGYNTVADLLRTGCPAILCPYAGIRQNEQTTRASRLHERGLATMVADTDLTPRAIADAIERTIAAPMPKTALDLDGAAATARILRQLMQQRA